MNHDHEAPGFAGLASEEPFSASEARPARSRALPAPSLLAMVFGFKEGVGGIITYGPFGGSGPGHSQGLVPDPGPVAGTSRFLNEDGTWTVPPDDRLPLPDFPAGGPIGTAPDTVDTFAEIVIDQTTADQDLELPAPTVDTTPTVVMVANSGAVPFTMHTKTIPVNGSAVFVWNANNAVWGDPPSWMNPVDLPITLVGSHVIATATIDAWDTAHVQTEASGFALTLDPPTATQVGKRFRVVNVNASDTFTIQGLNLQANEAADFHWTGSAWAPLIRPTIVVSSRTVLSATSVTNLPDATMAIVTDGAGRRSYWDLDKTSAATADGANVIAATTGRWIRRLLALYQYVLQTVWYVDSVNGNDDNDGLTSVTALATIREWYCRTMTNFVSNGTTLNLLGAAHPSTDLFCYWPTCRGGSGRTFVVKGTRTTTASGTFTAAATVIVPGTNTPNTATDAARVWVPGQRVVSTSGAVSGALAWVNLDVGGGVAQVSRWCTNGTGAASTSAAPATATNYSIVSLTTLAIGGDSRAVGNANVQFQDLSVTTTALLASSTRVVFMGCAIPLGIDANAMGAQLIDCDISGVAIQPKAGLWVAALGQARSVKIGPVGCAQMQVQDFVCQGAGSGLTADLGGALATASDVMVKNATSAIAPTRGGRIAVTAGTLSGAGNTTVVAPRSRGTLHVFTGYTPTITGATEIAFVDGATIMPTLVAGAYPAANVAMATWANWTAQARRAQSQIDFAAILTD